MSRKNYFIILIILSLSACAHAPEKNVIRLPRIVAKVGNTNILSDQVRQESASRLVKWRQEQYNILKETLDDLIEQKLINAAAAKEGKTGDEWLKEKINKKIVPPTDTEIETLYEQSKAHLNGQTLEQVRPRLTDFLQNQQSQRLHDELINELKSQTPITVLLEPLRVRVTDNGRPSMGPKAAPVMIIEFSDYQCSFCARAEETIKQVHKVYGDLVRIVFRDYPLSFHPAAQKAAEAAGCAALQSQFWEMHDKMFQNSEALAIVNLNTYARELGLDMDKFENCLNSGKQADEVAKDLQDGNVAGVSGTPAFFINGRFLSGAQPFKKFAEVIDEELTRAGIKMPSKPLDLVAQPETGKGLVVTLWLF
jgi:protein-disulfide isomerase